jgi:AcrR family transcriptional regulator
LAAAADEFERQGFEGTRVADIAAAACVSNGALYGHFRSKSDLLAEALREKGLEELAALFAGDPDHTIVDMLSSIGRGLVRTPSTKGALVVEALVASRRDPDVAAMMSEHLTVGNALLTDLIKDGQAGGVVDPSVSPEALSRFCTMLLFGSLLLAPASLPSVTSEEWTGLIARIAQAFGASAADG